MSRYLDKSLSNFCQTVLDVNHFHPILSHLFYFGSLFIINTIDHDHSSTDFSYLSQKIDSIRFQYSIIHLVAVFECCFDHPLSNFHQTFTSRYNTWCYLIVIERVLLIDYHKATSNNGYNTNCTKHYRSSATVDRERPKASAI